MKRLIFNVLLIFSLTGVQAQESRFGIKGGLNFTNLVGDDYGADIRTSIHFGLLAEIAITKKFSIQPEILYSGQGTKNEDLVLKLDYVTLPIMAKIFVAEGFSLEAGPYVAYNLISEWKWQDGSMDFKDDTSLLDMGAGIGLEYELPTGVFFQARYNVGMLTIWNINYSMYGIEPGPDIENPQTKNVGVQLSVGYKF